MSHAPLPSRVFVVLGRQQQGRLRWGWALLALLVLAVSAAGGWWWMQRASASKADAGPAITTSSASRPAGRFSPGGQVLPVSVGTVRRQDMRVLVNAIGVMQARATAVVRAKVSGELMAVHFKEGQEVQAGQLLAEIDARSYRAALAQVEGTLQRDAATLTNARLDLQRYQQLQATDSIASQQVDTQAALVRQLEGSVAAVRAQVDAARLQLAHTRVLAPFAGRLGLRLADVGNVVGPGDANGIVTINQTRPIDAAFSIPEASLAAMRRHQDMGEPIVVELWDRELRGRLAVGRVTALDNAIDPATGTLKVKATFANEDRSLYPNQFVNVRVQVQRLAQQLTVPVTALQNNLVYLVLPDGTVTQRKVRVGVTDGDRVVVEGDLPDDGQVVVDGLDRLREGSRVAVIDAQVAQKADTGAQEAAARRAEVMRNLTPAEREKLAAMSPQERRAFLRAKVQGSAAAAPGAAASSPPAASAAAPASVTLAPGRGEMRSETLPKGRPELQGEGRSAAAPATSASAPPDWEAVFARLPPDVRALLLALPPQELERWKQLPPQERRAFVRERLAAQNGAAR